MCLSVVASGLRGAVKLPELCAKDLHYQETEKGSRLWLVSQAETSHYLWQKSSCSKYLKCIQELGENTESTHEGEELSLGGGQDASPWTWHISCPVSLNWFPR